MKFDSKYPWYLFDMALFTVINGILLWVVGRTGKTIVITPFWIIVVAFAVFRGANVIANERITQVFRSPFVKLVMKEGKEIEEPFVSGFRGAMGALLYCPSCCGIWVAMILVYGLIFFPSIFSIVVVILALSAGERILTTVIQYLKIHAE